ncbi:MAG TPA: excinuclease ABC subunit UvrC [Candidatus Gracilibacteria bacterium]
MAKPKDPEFKFNAKDIPVGPGCYLFYGEEDDLLYVGKAKNLRKRVTSYFQKDHESNRTTVMVKKIRRIETRLVGSEIESLILENNLIKEYMPRFNVRLRDDKNFMYIRITKEDFPKMELVRKMVKDGSTYIGPKTSTKNLRETIRFCQKFFGVRMVKPGQDYYLNVVSSEKISAAKYQSHIEDMKKFLKGHTGEVVKALQTKMMDFASEKNFEAAAKTRDLLVSIQGSTEKQVVAFTDGIDRDFVNFVRDEHRAYFIRMAYREGRYRDQNEVTLEAESFESDSDVVEKFLLQFYEKVSDPPKEIVLPLDLESSSLVESLIQINLSHSQKGDKEKVLRITKLNAEKFRDTENLAAMSHEENFAKALPELAKALDLKVPPRRIECYDISHFAGQGTVGSMVVFVDGKPANNQYRRFHIKSLEAGAIDDFASMAEVLGRRFGRTEPPSRPVLGEEITMKPVKTKADWKTYHDIREKEIFHRYHGTDFEYNRDHPDEKKKDKHPFVFVKEGEIIGTVRLDHKGKKRIILRLFAIREELQGKGYGSQAMQLIEDYTRSQDRSEIVLNANKATVPFYEKHNFALEFWKGDTDLEDSVPIGKKLTPVKEKWEHPDLIILDGGKGQLSSVLKSSSFQVPEGFDPQTQIIALAKREEQIFRPGTKEPLELDFNNPALKLLQRIRDEAHRFAITFNRAIRKKTAIKSALDEIPGIGGATKKKLMAHFETVANIRKAEDGALLEILNQKQLESLRRHLGFAFSHAKL